MSLNVCRDLIERIDEIERLLVKYFPNSEVVDCRDLILDELELNPNQSNAKIATDIAISCPYP